MDILLIIIILGLGIVTYRSPISVLRFLAFPTKISIYLKDYSKYPNKGAIDRIILLYSDADKFSIDYSTLVERVKWQGMFMIVFAAIMIFILLLKW